MQNYGGENLSVNFSIPDLRNLVNWAKFNAVMDIILGALACIGIITAAYGIPQIIAGVKLYNATESLNKYLLDKDMQKISEAFSSFNKYFKISGVAIIIRISLLILSILLSFAFITYVFSHIPEMIKSVPEDYGF